MAEVPYKYKTDYPKTKFSVEFIRKHGLIEDVLGAFLETQMKEVEKLLKHKYPEASKAALPKLLNRFVTLEGTKRPMAVSEINQQELTKEQIIFCLEKMERARILRQEDDLFELAHDTLALHIAEQRSADEIALLEVIKMIKDRHQMYPQTQTLLNANELQLVAFNKETLKKESLLDSEEWTFIAKSKREKNRRHRLRQLLIFALIGVLSSFSLFSFVQSNKAKQKEREAIEARKAAENNLQQLKIEQAQKTAAKYKEHLALGKNLMSEDSYLEAIKEFETALAFNENGEEAKKLQKEAALRTDVDDRFERLMKEGNILETRDPSTLVDAHNKYKQARQLSFNNALVEHKIEQVKGKLENAFDKFIKDGNVFFEAEKFEMALKNYQQALRIKKEDIGLKQKVDVCKRKLDLN